MDGWYLTVDQFLWILYPRIAASTKSVKVAGPHPMKEAESTLKRIFQSLQSTVIVDCQLFSITIDLKLCFIEFLDEGSSVQLDGRVRI